MIGAAVRAIIEIVVSVVSSALDGEGVGPCRIR